ncbi:metal ABC transporter permease [Leptolyngbya sp. AN02str]|uniref:metal ABC transporter permease n=1 Tax=Leptolyngbya sp. AN02str TaxID=3423363 RepID=UPI003D32310D
MLDWLLDPLSYQFMQNAIAVGVLVGILCPVVGSFLIVQRMALLGDVIAHAVLPGLAIANFLQAGILVGSFISGMLSTALIAWIRSQTRVKVDAAMALAFSSFFSLGILLFTLLDTRLNLEEILFGDILSVSTADVWQAGVITVLLLVVVRLFYKELLFYTFDRAGAEAAGLPVNLIHYSMMAAITLAIIVGMQTVGVVLVISLLVGPAITAYLLVKQLHWMMILGAGLGVVASLSGMYISYYRDVPSGPAIALVTFALFFLALLFSPYQGILTRPRAARKSDNS